MLKKEEKVSKFRFSCDEQVTELLGKLAHKRGVTKAEIVRRSIGLYAWALEQNEAGHELILSRKDGSSAEVVWGENL
jgi:hypothetical protein